MNMEIPKQPFYIFGKHAVVDLIKREPDRIHHVYVRDSVKEQSFAGIYSLAKEKNIHIDALPESKIQDLVGDDARHQGVIAKIDPIDYTPFQELQKTIEERMQKNKSNAFFYLDGIQDQHNFGAIIRSATASNIQGILVPTRNQAPISTATYKTSVGTLGILPICNLSHPKKSLLQLQDMGFTIIGWDADGNQSLWSVPMTENIIWVIGGEHEGISSPIRSIVDTMAKIPLAHNVESLNASVTAALVAFEWKRRQS
jgi:23S rRNA (guanosine2251-2'-O)-methyltransferase